MDGLTRITERIARDTESEAAELLLHAREDAHSKLSQYQKAAEEATAHRSAFGQAQAQEIIQRTVSAAELDARKTVLSVKQELVAKVFEDALMTIKALPDDDMCAFLARLAVKASKTGQEEILLNENDHHRFGAMVAEAANRHLTQAGSSAQLRLSSETRLISGGLILKDGPVETNCSLEVLIKQAQKQLTTEIARMLFDA